MMPSAVSSATRLTLEMTVGVPREAGACSHAALAGALLPLGGTANQPLYACRVAWRAA
jgi:hypothetical protein